MKRNRMVLNHKRKNERDMKVSIGRAVARVTLAFLVASFSVAAEVDGIDSNSRTLESDQSATIDLGIDEDRIPEDLRAALPTVGEVNELYGSEPVVLGMDRCEAFREKYAPQERFMAIAGLYNSGTNFIFDTLLNNCEIPERQTDKRGEFARGILSGVHWGKHSPLSLRETHILPKYEGLNEMADFARFNAMPVVIVKDPVFWMASMCRRWYDVLSIEQDRRRYARCPYLVSAESGAPLPVTGSLNPFHEEFEYESLVDLWNSFYQAYEEFDAPRLIVRYEDLIFHGDKVVREICSCAGGTVKQYAPKEDSTKLTVQDQNEDHGLVQSASIYGSNQRRSEVFKLDIDRAFAENNLDKDLMMKLGYQIPRKKTSEDMEFYPNIPHTIWFVQQKDALSEMYFKAVSTTIDTYKELWDEPDAEVNFLSETDCNNLVGQLLPDIRSDFELDQDVIRKIELCKIAALYKFGGYYFGATVETVQAFQPKDGVTYASSLACLQGRCTLSRDFLASVPEHQLLKVALEEFAYSYRRQMSAGSTELVLRKVSQIYETAISDVKKSQNFQIFEEVSLDLIPNMEKFPRQREWGACSVAVRDADGSHQIRFISHIMDSEECPDKSGFSKV